MPSIIQGNVLTHSVAYNNFRNEYFVIMDVDQNRDNIPDRVYGCRINGLGQILGSRLIDFTLRGVSSKRNYMKNYSMIDSKICTFSSFLDHFFGNYMIVKQLPHWSNLG